MLKIFLKKLIKFQTYSLRLLFVHKGHYPNLKEILRHLINGLAQFL